MKNAAKRDEWHDRAGNPEEEWDSIDQELDPGICWQRSTHVLPRLRIVTELEEYLIPWVHRPLFSGDRDSYFAWSLVHNRGGSSAETTLRHVAA